MEKTNHKGVEYSLSEKAGLYLPGDMAYQRDHPVLSRAKSIGRAAGRFAAGAGIVALVAGPNIATNVAHAEDKESTPQVEVKDATGSNYNFLLQNLTLGPDDEILMHGQLDHANGSRVVAQTINNPYVDPTEASLNISAISPKSKIIGVDAQGEASYQMTKGNGPSYNGLVRVFPDSGLVFRAGATGNGSLEEFLGTELNASGLARKLGLNLKQLTINADGYKKGKIVNAHGYGSVSFPIGNSDMYASFGGSTSQKDLMAIAGLFEKNGKGIYVQGNTDSDDNKQSGKVIFVPNGNTYNAGTGDFTSALSTNIGMRGENTDNTIIGLAPYDAQMADGINGKFALVGKVDNDPDKFSASIGAWHRSPNLIVGATPKIIRDRVANKTRGSLILDVYGDIPGTPLGAALEIEQDTDGNTNGLIYGGANFKF